MLQEITSFLIKVGEHCLRCEGKTMEPEYTTYHIPTQTMPILEKPQKQKTHVYNVKKSYLSKWITNGSFEVFTIEQFYRAYPKQRENKELDHNILKLLKAKKIAQLGKNKYMVNR